MTWGWLERLLGRKPAAPPPAAEPSPPAEWPSMTQLRAMLTSMGIAGADGWTAALQPQLVRYGITTPRRLTAFLANVAHESADFTRLVENLNYTKAERIRAVWPSRFPTLDAATPYVRNPERLANRVYSNRMGNGSEASGDGWRHRGRGLIQITGRANYAAAASALGKSLDDAFLAWCETRDGAAATACWWWAAHGCNAIADRDDAVRLRERINGGLNGLADVKERMERVARLV